MNALTDFEDRFGPAGKPLSYLIRPSFVAPPKRWLVWGDWAAIEARTLPWLAASPGAEEVLDVFRASDADPDAPDIYMREAGGIRGKDPRDVTKDERQEGKVAVLSLGFGGAVGALQNMAANYGLSLSDTEAKRIVDMWRGNNQWARDFWNQLFDAFKHALESPGTVFAAGRVAFVYEPEYMNTVHMALPDARLISYPRVRWAEREVENELGEVEIKKGYVYRKGDEIRGLWYGSLAENATQGTAGSLLRRTMARMQPAPLLDATGRPVPAERPGEIIGHTHDEIVCETSEDPADIEATCRWLHHHMTLVEPWAAGLPLVAEIEHNDYYTKGKGISTAWHFSER